MFSCFQRGEAVLEEEGTAGDEKLRLLILLFVPNRIVIPTGAYPDFLPRSTGQAACAPFCKGKAHEVHQRHKLPQEIRGSVVEGPAVHHPQYRI
jgi:hypothetical protein